MIRALTPVQSRALALGLLGCVLLTVNGVVVRPVMDIHLSQRDAIGRARDLLHRYDRLAGARSALESQAGQLRQREAGHLLYLTGASDQLAGAGLQNHLKNLVERSGGEPQSSQMLPAREEGGFHRVAIRLQLVSDTAGLQKMLHAIEAGRPALFIDSLDIRARSSAAPRAGQAPDPADSRLEVRMDVYGYRQEGAS